MDWTALNTTLEFLVFALVVGVIAKVLMPGKDPGQLIGTTVIGIGGGVIGGCLGGQVGLTGDSDIVAFVTAIIGALMLLMLYRWLTT
ncbi:MAG: GlsB/YeaQ/YmgE family stress response membrane protein [Nitrospirota bacterium]|nr:GlsB/YeaQ/YmgE family stress response membrane protein [Nitrospirota bacterium]MDP2383665.1 GlsB/YeaQ/YmgE family stress response membrane protein [Nitrospirota bacterium]MDP3596786.1 GlsB/YeaQ/YmgE family stress response membrane protein [Nitrospirota bacterium]